MKTSEGMPIANHVADVPLIIRLASGIPQHWALGTQTTTKAREELDDDVDLDFHRRLPAPALPEILGAIYDEHQSIWLKGGQPLVLDAAACLGTSTHTRVRSEEADEDPG